MDNAICTTNNDFNTVDVPMKLDEKFTVSLTKQTFVIFSNKQRNEYIKVSNIICFVNNITVQR